MHACSVALVREAVLPAGVAETPIAALGTVEGKHPAGAGVTRLVPIMGTVAQMLVPCVAPAKIPAEIPEAVLGGVFWGGVLFGRAPPATKTATNGRKQSAFKLPDPTFKCDRLTRY